MRYGSFYEAAVLLIVISALTVGFDRAAVTDDCKPAGARSSAVSDRLKRLVTSTDTGMPQHRARYGIPATLSANQVVLLASEPTCVRGSAAVDTVETRASITGISVHVFGVGSHYVVDRDTEREAPQPDAASRRIGEQVEVSKRAKERLLDYVARVGGLTDERLRNR